MVDPNHPLLPIALCCLEDKDTDRYSAQELCRLLVALKQTPEYIDSMRAAEEHHIQEQGNSVQQMEQLSEVHSQEVEGLQQRLASMEQMIIQKDAIIAVTQLETQQVREQHREEIQQLEREKNREVEERLENITRHNAEMVSARLQEIQEQHVNEIQLLENEKERRINEIKEHSAEAIKQRDETIAAHVQEIEQLKHKCRDGILAEEGYVEEVRSQLEYYREAVQVADETIAAKVQEIKQLKQKHREEIEQLQRDKTGDVIKDLVQQLGQAQLQVQSQDRDQDATTMNLKWKEGKVAPCTKANGPCSAATDGNVVYFIADTTVYAYVVSTSTWSQLPDTDLIDCPAVIINNLLTLVGGRCGDRVTNKLISLTGQKWTEVYRFMPSRRCASTALCTNNVLIVAGGQGDRGPLPTVEIMNVLTNKWAIAPHLPESKIYGSLVEFRGDIYMLGGLDKRRNSSKSAYRCPLSALLGALSASSSIDAHISRLLLALTSDTPTWSKLADLPFVCSACVHLQDKLLAIGGMDSHGTPVTGVYAYNMSFSKWELFSQMSVGRCDCCAVVAPDNTLFLAGGKTKDGAINTIEIATPP